LEKLINKDLKCRACIYSAEASLKTIVYCCLDQEAVEKVADTHFCGQGHWLIDDLLLGYTSALRYIAKKEDPEKEDDLSVPPRNYSMKVGGVRKLPRKRSFKGDRI